MAFICLVTDLGQAKIAAAIGTGGTVNIVECAVGDGGGAPTTPSSSDTSLVNEVGGTRFSVNEITRNLNQVSVNFQVPYTVGGFTIREVACFDDDGDMILIANVPEDEKPGAGETGQKTANYTLTATVQDGDVVQVTVDPLAANASKAYVGQNFVRRVPDLPALRALTGMQEGQATQITSTGRTGLFRWDPSDLKAECDADPRMGIYVPPTGQDGSAGAWKLVQGGAEKFLVKDKAQVTIGENETFHTIAGEDDGAVSGYEITGAGRDVGESYGVHALNNSGSARNNVIKDMTFRDLSGAAVKWTGGWNNLLINSRAINCATGIKTEEYETVSSWALSGFLSVNNYFSTGSGPTGGVCIDNASAWNFVSICDVFEYSRQAVKQNSSGRADIYIGTWVDGNTEPNEWRRPSIIIGGRGWEFSDVSLFNNARHLVRLGVGDLTGIIGNNGYTFSVDGAAVQNFVPSLTGVGFAIEDNLGATAKQVRYQIGGGTDVRHNGEVTGGYIPLNVMRGSAYRWSTNPAAMEGARVEIQGTASNAASGSGANRVAIYTEHVTTDESIVDSGYRWYFEHRGHLTPASDNAYDIGSASFRPREIFAAQGTINTSDKRLKTDPDAAALDAAVAAWASVRSHAWKWLQSVEDKGEQARIHIGPFAQDIIAAFEAQGLDPFDYGLLCSDPVFELVETEQTITRTRQVTKFREENGETLDYREDEEYEDIVTAQEQVPVLDENGKQEVVYSLRPTECLFLEMEYSRRRFEAIEDRLDAAGI